MYNNAFQVKYNYQSYAELLMDQRWKEFRLMVLARDRYQCRNCCSKLNLQVHHRQYHRDKITGNKKMPWEYDLQFLITLCDECHNVGHENYKIQSFKI